MKNLYIYPHNMTSKSSKLIADALNSVRIYADGKFSADNRKIVINWGCSVVPKWEEMDLLYILNKVSAVKAASNKLESFARFEDHEVQCPESTSESDEAIGWLRDGHKVVERRLLRAHSGKGIILLDPKDPEITELLESGDTSGIFNPKTRLFTKYIPKADEYRVHVGKSLINHRPKIIDVQQKKKRRDVESSDVDYQIRNHSSGWVYCREGVELPDHVIGLALEAVVALGLDFGAVDIIHNRKHDKYYVLEVNTAPGLEGTTLDSYVSYFTYVRELYEGGSNNEDDSENEDEDPDEDFPGDDGDEPSLVWTNERLQASTRVSDGMLGINIQAPTVAMNTGVSRTRGGSPDVERLDDWIYPDNRQEPDNE